MKALFIQFSLLFLIESNAIAGIFGPNNYDECILENMKGTQTEHAALLVANSCASKFKKKDNLTLKERFFFFEAAVSIVSVIYILLYFI